MAKIRTESGGSVQMKVSALVGKKVRTRRPLHNSLGGIPAGVVCTVLMCWRSGVTLTTPACKECGIVFHIGHVPRDDIELLKGDG